MKKKDIIIIAAVLAAALALFGVSQIAGQGGLDRRGDGGRAGGAPPPAGHVGHL